VPKRKRLVDLPKLPGVGKPKKAKRLQKFSIFPRGWRHLKLGVRRARIGIGPGDPPLGFVGAHTSRTEWLVYWALAKKFGDPKDPRQAPFTGSRLGTWFYQVMDQGGRVPAGSVSDFQVKTPLGWIIMRVDTERWHIFASAAQQAKDLFLKTHLKTGKVVTLYEQDFIADDTGEAVMKVVALALKGLELPNPIRTGQALRRRPK
jgi:hypothetical protein